MATLTLPNGETLIVRRYKEVSDLHSHYRWSYEFQVSDGFRSQQYEIGRVRQIISRRYGVTQKWLRANGV